MTDRRLILASAAAGLALAVGLGFGLGRVTQAPPAVDADHESSEPAPHEDGFVALNAADALKAGVLTTTVGRGGGGELVLPGRVALAANASAALAASVSGAVERVQVAPGDRVTAGAAIAVLRGAEGADARAQLDTAKAAARAAQAADRDRRLFDAGVVARQDWEASQAFADKARAELRAAQAKVAAQGAPNSQGLSVLRAPIGGVVTRVDARVGGFLTEGALVAEIADQSQVEYVFDAPPASADAIKVGDAIRVQMPDGQEASARIVAVAPSAIGAGAAVVRAKPTSPAPRIGAIVSARVVLAKGQGGLTVPADAVQTLEGRSVVFVAEAKGFRARPVMVGRTAAGSVEILKGLSGDERIAGKGAFRLKAELGKGEAGHED